MALIIIIRQMIGALNGTFYIFSFYHKKNNFSMFHFLNQLRFL